MSEPIGPAPRALHAAPRFAMPAGATDCHMHVFGPASRYPWAERRAYTPPDAALDSYLSMARQVGLARVVLVQPTVYGADNRAILGAMAVLGPDCARGVGGIGSQTSEAELEAIAATGIRGVRLVTHPQTDPTALRGRIAGLAQRLAPHGLHLELLLAPATLTALEETLAAAATPIVVDHAGQPVLADGLAQPGFAALLRLLAGGRVWAKLSAPYRFGGAAGQPPEAGLPYLRALMVAAPHRVVWGSDWPHTSDRIGGNLGAESRVEFRQLDVGQQLDLLAAALPSAAALRDVLVANPAALYGFG